MCDGTQSNNNKATHFAASANAISFKHLHFSPADLSGRSLRISKKMLATLGVQAGSEAMMIVREGELSIITDPARIALLRAAEELQLRQDESKQDYSKGIIKLIDGV